MKTIARIAFVLIAGCLPGMVGNPQRTVTSLELRAAVIGVDPMRLDPKMRSALENGMIWPGATETELYLARGTPNMWWGTRLGQNACKEFVHHGSDPALADLAVTTCGNRVIQAKRIDPPLPCWRLAEVGPRIQAQLAYFEQRPLEVQWQIVIGLLHRGQAEQDVLVAFGDPHSRGFDEREDGKRAERLVFLDHSGDAYGLNVTLVDKKVVGWAMPAERTLTPEAQQRKLEAMEKRLNDKIAEVDRKVAMQHAETVKLFGDVMSRQDSMMSQLTNVQATQTAQVMATMMQSRGGGGSAPTGGPSYQPVDAAPPPQPQQQPQIQLPEAKTCKCPEIACGDRAGMIKVQACSARCMGAEPACRCDGRCEHSGNVLSTTAHHCGCS